jgi:hypothetical protein
MDLTIRTAVMEDAMAIARVGLDSHIEAYRPLLGEDYGAGAGLEATAQYWRKLLSHDSSVEHVELEVLVAEKDGEISAYSGIGASRDPDGAGAGEVFTLYVHHRRGGPALGGGSSPRRRPTSTRWATRR